MIKLADYSNKQLVKQILTFVFPLSIYLVLMCIGLAAEGSQQFSLLANSFIHGHTYFLHPIGGVGQDPVFYNNRIYWDEGPFPAVILMPFVGIFDLFHKLFFQGYIKWVFVLGVGFFVYKLARHLKYNQQDSLMLTMAFSLGSVFMGVASVSSGWLYAQVVGAFLMFWAFYEYYNRKRYWLIGLICSMVLLTRITAAPMVLFFVLVIVLEKSETKQKVKNLVKLLSIMVFSVLIIGVYNYNRFGDPFNNGNQYQLLSAESSEARSLGLFSLDHIPSNLYTAVLRGPLPVLKDSTSWTLKYPYITNNPLGISIILTSPYLLYLFSKKWSKYPKEAKYLIIAAAVSGLLVLSYFGDGADQFGYRYSLDFMPELFIVFMMLYKLNNKVLSAGMKTLIVLSCIFNFYLVCSYIK